LAFEVVFAFNEKDLNLMIPLKFWSQKFVNVYEKKNMSFEQASVWIPGSYGRDPIVGSSVSHARARSFATACVFERTRADTYANS